MTVETSAALQFLQIEDFIFPFQVSIRIQPHAYKKHQIWIQGDYHPQESSDLNDILALFLKWQKQKKSLSIFSQETQRFSIYQIQDFEFRIHPLEHFENSRRFQIKAIQDPLVLQIQSKNENLFYEKKIFKIQIDSSFYALARYFYSAYFYYPLISFYKKDSNSSNEKNLNIPKGSLLTFIQPSLYLYSLDPREKDFLNFYQISKIYYGSEDFFYKIKNANKDHFKESPMIDLIIPPLLTGSERIYHQDLIENDWVESFIS